MGLTFAVYEKLVLDTNGLPRGAGQPVRIVRGGLLIFQSEFLELGIV